MLYNFRCEIDGLFENLLTKFLVEEPERMSPYLSTLNELISIFEGEIVGLKQNFTQLGEEFSS